MSSDPCHDNNSEPASFKDLATIKSEILSQGEMLRQSGEVLRHSWNELYSLLGSYESKLIAMENEIALEKAGSLEKTDKLQDFSKNYGRLKHELNAKDLLLKRTQEELFREKKKLYQYQSRQGLLEGEIIALRDQLNKQKHADTVDHTTYQQVMDYSGTNHGVTMNHADITDSQGNDLAEEEEEEEEEIDENVRPSDRAEHESVHVKTEPSSDHDVKLTDQDEGPQSSNRDGSNFDELVISALYSHPIGGASQINITPRRPSRRRCSPPAPSTSMTPLQTPDLASVLAPRSVACRVCGAEFAKQAHLAKHMFVHEQRHKCPECGRLVRDVQKHVSSVHSPAKQHTCSFCGKGYADAHSLRTHVRNHTGEKPYECAFCHKRFTAKIYLRVHERTHSGEQRYCCSQCGQRFAQRTQLTKHSAKYHGLGHLAMMDTGT